ncbi:hypothetical protein ACLOJK_012869 [Asimina triloba]
MAAGLAREEGEDQHKKLLRCGRNNNNNSTTDATEQLLRAYDCGFLIKWGEVKAHGIDVVIVKK